jgi:hypothetical protein
MAVLRILHSAQTLDDHYTRSTAAKFNGSIFPSWEVPKLRGKMLPPNSLTLHPPVFSIANACTHSQAQVQLRKEAELHHQINAGTPHSYPSVGNS